MNVSRLRLLAALSIITILAHQPLAIGAEPQSFVAAQCYLSKYYMKPINDESVVDQGTIFYQKNINLSRRDRPQPFGPNIPSWVGSQTIDIENGYALAITIDFMKNGVLGDFEQPDPAIALDAKLIYKRNSTRFLSSATAGGSTLDADTSFVAVSATVNDAELETLLANAGIAIPPPLEYGPGFRYWAAIRDHFGDALNFSTFADFLKPLGRVSNLVVPSVSVTCNVKRPGM